MCHSTKDVWQKWDLVGEIQWDMLTLHSRCRYGIHKHSREIWCHACDTDTPHIVVCGPHTLTQFLWILCDKVSADRLAKNKLSHITAILMMHWCCFVEGLGHKCVTGEDSQLWAALFHKDLGLGFTGIMGGVIQPLAFGLKFVKAGSPEDAGTSCWLLIIIWWVMVWWAMGWWVRVLGRRALEKGRELQWRK